MPDIDFAEAWAERWANWGRWLHYVGSGRPKYQTDDGKVHVQSVIKTDSGNRWGPKPPGQYVGKYYDPPLPALPKTLADVPGCGEYDVVAPWGGPIEKAWIAGCEHPAEPCPTFTPVRDASVERQRNAWNNGRLVGKSKAGAVYRNYLAACRAVLKKDGWAEDEIP